MAADNSWGSCPNCGGWRTPGMIHDCEAEKRRQREEADKLNAIFHKFFGDEHISRGYN